MGAKGFRSAALCQKSVLLDLLSAILSPERKQNWGRPGRPHGERKVFMYEVEYVRGHVEVYLNGRFCFSADTRGEAEAEIRELSA